MAPIASSSSVTAAAAAVVASSPNEDLIKSTEEALKMNGINEMRANGPFDMFCERLKTCSADEILIVLPMILKGCESVEGFSPLLLSALSENSEMKKALSALLKNLEVMAQIYNSAKMLDGLCSSLKKAEMDSDLVQLLIGVSQHLDVDLRSVACRRLCHMVCQTDLHAYFHKMYAAAILCLNEDSDQSRDLAVVYFAALFHDWYFFGDPLFESHLTLVIKQARNMLVSAEEGRMLDAKDFFEEFITNATDAQFALLPQDIAKEWEEYSADEEWGETFQPLSEKYQKRTAEAVSNS